jgi:hypothetical protein
VRSGLAEFGIVDLGIDWSHIETMTDLQTGLGVVLAGQTIKGKLNQTK